ncbi:MAG: hypothetical protein M0R40_06440 [Firmicutes bacterium]|nr:hypothetical protein [Bacillota bacterium]
MRYMFVKIAIVVIVAVMVCGSFAVAETAVPLDNEAFKTLSALGFLEEIKPIDTPVSVGEFLTLTLKLGGYDQLQDGGKDALLMAQQAGLLDGVHVSVVAGENVEVSFAAAVLMNLLGYGVYAGNQGGYPVGYLVYANQVRILSGIGAVGSSLTFGSMVQMVYNILDLEVVRQADFGALKKFEIKTGETILSERHSIYKRRGIVETAGGSSILSSFSRSKGFCQIDNEMLKDELGLSKEFLGCNVEYYCYFDEKAAIECSLLHIKEKKGKNNIFRVTPRAIFTSETTERLLVFENDDGYIQKLNLALGVSVVYNGSFYFEYTKETLFPQIGSVTLIDNNNDDIIDVVLIESFEVYRVKSVNIARETIYDQCGKEAIDVSLFDEISLAKAGQQIELGMIKNDDMLLAAQSADGKIFSGIVLTDIVKGNVSELSESEIIVRDQTYPLSLGFKDASQGAQVGCRGSLYLDESGEAVAFIKAEVYGEYYAYLLGAKQESVLGGGAGLFKFLTPDSEFVVKRAEDKLILNGKQVKIDKAVAELKDKKQVVLLTENDDGDIEEIKTAKDNTAIAGYSGYDEDSFSKDEKDIGFSIGRIRNSYKHNYEPFLLAFFIPTDTDADEDYYAETAISWTSDNIIKTNVDLYDVNRFMQPSVIVINDYDADGSAGEPHVSIVGVETWFFAISKVSQVVDTDGNPTAKIAGWSNGRYVEYFAKDLSVKNVSEYIKPSDGMRLYDTVPNISTKWGFTSYTVLDLRAGDVMQIALDGKKKITAFRLIFSAHSGGIDSLEFAPGEFYEISASVNMPDTPYIYESQMYTAYGEVTDSAGDLVRYRTQLITPVPAVEKVTIERAVKITNNVYIFDQALKTVTRGTVSDAKVGDRVLVHGPTGQGMVGNTLIIR